VESYEVKQAASGHHTATASRRHTASLGVTPREKFPTTRLACKRGRLGPRARRQTTRPPWRSSGWRGGGPCVGPERQLVVCTVVDDQRPPGTATSRRSRSASARGCWLR